MKYKMLDGLFDVSTDNNHSDKWQEKSNEEGGQELKTSRRSEFP